MLNPKPGKLTTYMFLVGVEAEMDRLSPEQVSNKLSDALNWVEGSGSVDVSFIGIMEATDDPDQPFPIDGE